MTGESLSQCQTADVQRTLADCLGENWQSVGKCQTASNLGVIHMSFVWFDCEVVREGSRRFDAVEPLRTRVQVLRSPRESVRREGSVVRRKQSV